MTRQDAINWANSKIGQYLDYDGLFGTQCVDFFNFYYEYVTGLKPYAQGLGVAYAYQLASKRPAGLTWVPNNPSDKNQLPSNGDILVMSGTNGFGGGAGHVLVSMNTDSNAVRGIDETPNTKVAARQYSWANVLGWFVPNSFAQSQGDTKVDTLKSMYMRLLGRPGDEPGIAHYLKEVDARGWQFVYNDLKNSQEGQKDWERRNPDRVTELEKLASKPPQVVEKIVEKPVEVIKEVRIPTDFDQLSLGELLAAAFQKLFKIK